MAITESFRTGTEVRCRAREGHQQGPTAGLAPGHLQANLIVLPSQYADDFRLLCKRNPVTCPLIAESLCPGDFSALRSHCDHLPAARLMSGQLDLRRDVPKYMVYKDGQLTTSHCSNIVDLWTRDHVAFLIGCSFSFETALCQAGLPPRHIKTDRNVPMYRTKLPLMPAGIFKNCVAVVSMRPYRISEIEDVRNITRPFVETHGEPIAWGWDALQTLGIESLERPDFGEAPELNATATRDTGSMDEVVPVFWGCGVTPQEAVTRSKLSDTVMAHAPGHMLVLDARDEDLLHLSISVL